MSLSAQASPAAGEADKTGCHRVLLKLSGEALMGDRAFGIDQERVESLSKEIVSADVGSR